MRCKKSGKIIYTKKDAQTAKNAAKHFGKKFDIYPCSNHWHLTTKRKR